MVREALWNALRHARPRQIVVLAEREGQEIALTVEDNGRGFEPGVWWKNSQHHFGLSIMHARAARMGGTLEIDSAPGRGTRVVLSLPLDGRDGNVAGRDSIGRRPPGHNPQGIEHHEQDPCVDR